MKYDEYESPFRKKPEQVKPPGKKQKKEMSGRTKIIITFFILAFFITAGTLAGIFLAYTREVPEVADLKNYKPDLSTTIYDNEGNLVSQLYTKQRTIVRLSDIPMNLQNAILAKEDPNFYRHNGFDLRGILRATVNNLMHGKIVEGGSTITQQLARNLFLTREKRFTRKIKELLLALQIEKYYTKNEILELYCNQIYFGSGAYGVEAAARTYFGKHIHELNLPECAMLAALPQAPSAFSPYRNKDLAREKRDIVLSKMSAANYITEEEKEYALSIPIKLSRLEVKNAPYFVEYARKQLEETYGNSIIYKGGLKVHTTIDSKQQQVAQEVFNERIKKLEERIKAYKGVDELKEPLQGAMLAMDPHTGEIKIMIGGIDFAESKFNRAVQARRQTGSAFKPMVYTTAIDNGFRVSDVIMDSPIVFRNENGTRWKPENFNGKFMGPMILMNGITHSKNVVTVKLLNKIGVRTVHRYARKMGITSPLSDDLTLALGSSSLSLLEMVTAFSTIANGGMRIQPLSIRSVKDSNGRILEQHSPRLSEALPETTAYIVTYMMENVVNRGTGRVVRRMGFRGAAAGKTGTTNGFTDAWFMGFTPEIVVGVWVGFDSTETMGRRMVGGAAAAPIWADFMLNTHSRSGREFPVPDNIIFKKICTKTGKLATKHCPYTVDGPFIEGTEPYQYCEIHSGVEVENFINEDLGSFDEWEESNYEIPENENNSDGGSEKPSPTPPPSGENTETSTDIGGDTLGF